jgi:hypothetical protein
MTRLRDESRSFVNSRWVDMIIDHIDKLEVPDDNLGIYGNELRSLTYLAQGLQFLYEQVKSTEDQIIEAVGRDKRHIIYGNHPALKSAPQGLIACAFHWYAVSACNYVRMVGWLVNGGDSKKARQYMQRVLPAVKLWRHKVGAHFAATAPRSEDTLADLAMSVMFPVAFDDDAFYTGALRLIMRHGTRTSASRTDMRWSLTHTHRELAARYWPSTPESVAPGIDAGLTLVAGAGDAVQPAG